MGAKQPLRAREKRVCRYPPPPPLDSHPRKYPYHPMLFPPKPPTPPEEQRATERAYHREVLHDLVRLGINTAKALERRAVDSSIDGTNTVIEASIAFERVARAIRRTILLAEKLAEPPAEDPPNTPKPHPTHKSPDSIRNETTQDNDTPEPPENHPDTDQEDRAESRAESVDDPREDPAHDAPTNRPIPEQIEAIRRDLTQDIPLIDQTQTELTIQERYPNNDWAGPPTKPQNSQTKKPQTRKPQA